MHYASHLLWHTADPCDAMFSAYGIPMLLHDAAGQRGSSRLRGMLTP
jgi:hypothetical protein